MTSLRRLPLVRLGILLTGATLACFAIYAQDASAPSAKVSPQATKPAVDPDPPQSGLPPGWAFPDRPKAPQDVVMRGKATFGVSCAFCHGSDAGGGETGPNLLGSAVVMQDRSGEMIMPIVHGSRVKQGMPPISITDAQVTEVADWLHSLKVDSHSNGREKINIVTGNAKSGEAYFAKTCASCHSITGDLKGIGSLVTDPKILQQTWLMPGGGGGKYGAIPAPKGIHVTPTGVTVYPPNGAPVTGELVRIDEFYVGLKLPDGSQRSFRRSGDTPKVELHDALAPHRALLSKYTDKDIHDVTAYLVTLK